MEFSKLIEDRRSIRDYAANVTVSAEEISEMVYAAQQAPSWKNSQSGRYYAVISKDSVEKVRTTCLPDFNRDRTVGVAGYIVTTFKSGNAGFRADGTQTDALGNGWGAYDLGLQNENLLLKARELGYDTLIMGLRDEEKLREMLFIPDDEIMVAVIAIGKRASDPEKPQRKDINDVLRIF
jgi:nitroreductase